MKTYITEKSISMERHEGPQFTAHNMKEAKKIAKRLGVTLMGRLRYVWISY